MAAQARPHRLASLTQNASTLLKYEFPVQFSIKSQSTLLQSINSSVPNAKLSEMHSSKGSPKKSKVAVDSNEQLNELSAKYKNADDLKNQLDKPLGIDTSIDKNEQSATSNTSTLHSNSSKKKKHNRKHKKKRGSTNQIQEVLSNSGNAADDSFYSGSTFKGLLTAPGTQKLCRHYNLTYKHIHKLHLVFQKYDIQYSDEITPDEFFDMINEPRRPIANGLFQYIDIHYSGKMDGHPVSITFDMFVQVIVRFSTLTRKELYRYTFNLYNSDSSGSLSIKEFQELCHSLQNPKFTFPKNVELAIEQISDFVKNFKKESRSNDSSFAFKNSSMQVPKGNEQVLIDMAMFTFFLEKYPVVFYPILNLQRHLRSIALGNKFWSNVTGRKVQIENMVKYMQEHKGRLPPLTIYQWMFYFIGKGHNIRFVREKAYKIYYGDHGMIKIRGESDTKSNYK